MRTLAPYLLPLLLCGAACGQEPDPARMVAGIFEETRAESEAIWRAYCAVNEDPGFSGTITDLPDWDQYVERVRTAASKRLADGVVMGSDRYGYGIFASNVAMGVQRYEWLERRQLVQIWAEHEGFPRESQEGLFVRVARDARGAWRLASWPPDSLENLFSERDRFPHRLVLTLHWEQEDALTREEQRREHFDRLLADVVLPQHRIGESGESLDGVLIRVPAKAPAPLLLELLAHLAQPDHRIPDVQLWVIDGDDGEVFYLNQRGAWGEDMEVMPLMIPREFTAAEAVAAARGASAVQECEVAFMTPWLGPGPDPRTFLHGLARQVRPICKKFWFEWFTTQEIGPGGVGNPQADDPDYLEMFSLSRELLAPHAAADLPDLDPANMRQALMAMSMDLVMPLLPQSPMTPNGYEWLHRITASTHQGSVVRIEYRNPVHHGTFQSPRVFLRLEGEVWKFCSWPRFGRSTLLMAPDALPFVPERNSMHATLSVGDAGHSLSIGGSDSDINGDTEESFLIAYEHWLTQDYKNAVIRHMRFDRDCPASKALTLWTDPDARQFALAPLLTMLAREDCPRTQLRIQVILDATERPGELVFDQSVTRPGATPGASHGIQLLPNESIEALCVRAERALRAGHTTLHLQLP